MSAGIIGILIMLGGLAGALFLGKRRASISTDAASSAHTTEKILTPKIAEAQAKLEALSKDTAKNADEIAKTHAEIAKHRKDLYAEYRSQDLSADEITARFRKLRL